MKVDEQLSVLPMFLTMKNRIFFATGSNFLSEPAEKAQLSLITRAMLQAQACNLTTRWINAISR